jgi:EAL and modified HD-GYP domain-containing signal transduction protein
MMTDNAVHVANAEEFVVTRQPVFDRKLEPWGTAICFAQAELDAGLFEDESTAGILLEASLPQRGFKREQTMLYFPASAVLARTPKLLWPESLIVEVDEAAGGLAEIVEAVADLKRAGYGIAVCGFRNESTSRELNHLADVLVINAVVGADLAQETPPLPELVGAAHALGAKAMVGGLSNWEAMLVARTAQADMLRGFFFNQMSLRPTNRSITATQLSRLRLLECLGKPDADFKTLARLVEADAALTYRLLVFLNSAGFGLGRKVDSIQQAIVLAGWQPLQRWLEVLLLTDLAPSPRHQELCYYAAQRAGFLKRVAKAAGLPRLVPQLSLLGLLSYVEPILEMSPAQALADVPVDDGIRLALCGRKRPFSPWLALVQAMERAHWDEAARLGQSAKLGMADLSRCYRESFVEADTLFRALSAPAPAPV